MRVVTVTEAKAHLPELIRHSRREAIVVTRNGHPCARIEALDKEDLDEEAFYRNPVFRRWLGQAYQGSFRQKRVKAGTLLRRLRRTGR